MDATQPRGQTRRAPLLLADLGTVDFSKGGGLLPAIVQHAASGAVLMLGYMSLESLVVTMARRRVVFFSRSKGRLWEKGEISGHSLEVEQIFADCDGDALLVSAWPRGPVCHLGSDSCFGDPWERRPRLTGILATLEEVISERMTSRTDGSYTTKLLQSGRQHIAQKVGEEGVEVALAAACGSEQEVAREVADLFYHVLVLLRERGLTLEHVLRELEARHLARAPTADASRAVTDSYQAAP